MGRTLEQGDIFFFYRPRVGIEEARDFEDVQRFFFVVKPDRRGLYREIVVGRKRLPDPLSHEREWAFVAEVTRRPAEMREHLARKEYETKTRGVRVQPEARPAGEGRYAIVDHEGSHTHLAYVLELPRELGPAQEVFGIEREASYIVAVGNPEAPRVQVAGLDPRRRAQFPPELLERFRSRRWIPVDPPDFLDYEGAELVIIGASADVKGELGIALETEDEDLERAEVFRRLRVRPGDVPVEPLTRGELR